MAKTLGLATAPVAIALPPVALPGIVPAVVPAAVPAAVPAHTSEAGPGTRADERSTLITLVVENMHCGRCMRTVETTLGALPGIAHARVNLSAKRVLVERLEGAIDTAGMITALAAKGFVARPLVADAARNAREVGPDRDYLKRLGVAGFGAANIMLLSVAVWSGYARDMPQSLQTMFHWLSALIALPTVAYAGQPFFRSARDALAGGRINMDVPISLGVVLATAMSLYQTMRGTEHVYFDAAVTLLFFLLIGRTLDQSMRARAASAADNLLIRRVSEATVVSADGALERIAVASVLPGMRISVAAGAELPVDGRVLSQHATIDESMVTGESAPRVVVANDRVFGGTVALSGPFEIEATNVADASLVAQLARLMQAAEQARGRYVRLADRAARIYAPGVHILSAATFVGWMWIGAGWESALTTAIAVLIITCPCALALAVPAVQVVATSRLFRAGVVVKSADALERLAEIDTIALDKTGTLTLGRPELVGRDAVDAKLLALAAGLAVHSRHPYAQAVVRAAQLRGLTPITVSSAVETPGAGVSGTVFGEAISLGSAAFCGADVGATSSASLWFCSGGCPPIALPVADELRPDAGAATRALKSRGFELEILSGDTPVAVKAVGDTLDIATWRAALLPQEKIDRVRALQAAGRKVLMVGDGLNDAPALAAGDASLSPSGAADISQMASDAVFQGDRLGSVALILDVAKAARRRALENFAIALGYNCVFVPLAVLGHVTPLLAAIAMSASSLAVMANALRLSGRGVSRPAGERS